MSISSKQDVEEFGRTLHSDGRLHNMSFRCRVHFRDRKGSVSYDTVYLLSGSRLRSIFKRPQMVCFAYRPGLPSVTGGWSQSLCTRLESGFRLEAGSSLRSHPQNAEWIIYYGHQKHSEIRQAENNFSLTNILVAFSLARLTYLSTLTVYFLSARSAHISRYLVGMKRYVLNKAGL